MTSTDAVAFARAAPPGEPALRAEALQRAVAVVDGIAEATLRCGTLLNVAISTWPCRA